MSPRIWQGGCGLSSMRSISSARRSIALTRDARKLHPPSFGYVQADWLCGVSPRGGHPSPVVSADRGRAGTLFPCRIALSKSSSRCGHPQGFDRFPVRVISSSAPSRPGRRPETRAKANSRSSSSSSSHDDDDVCARRCLSLTLPWSRVGPTSFAMGRPPREEAGQGQINHAREQRMVGDPPRDA